MPRPYVQVGTYKIAPFKNPKVEPYGAFANATLAWEYPVKESVTIHKETLHFNWPSAEHTFQAQKLIHLKIKLPANDPRQPILTKTLLQLEKIKSHPKEALLPHSDFALLIRNLIRHHPNLYFGKSMKDFDALCDAGYDPTNAPHQGLMPNGEPYLLDFMRHTLELKFEQNPQIKQLAIDCAREDIFPIEVSHIDNYWASGPNGDGQNKLGITILELGNHYLHEQENHHA
jgi:predicted NAD-dependent protein-ADP-ribosyltransferase YbiA (DUF1768 family)